MRSTSGCWWWTQTHIRGTCKTDINKSRKNNNGSDKFHAKYWRTQCIQHENCVQRNALSNPLQSCSVAYSYKNLADSRGKFIICSSFRTASVSAACVLVGIPPIELQIRERRECYTGTTREATRDNLIQERQYKWDSADWYQTWTHELTEHTGKWTIF